GRGPDHPVHVLGGLRLGTRHAAFLAPQLRLEAVRRRRLVVLPDFDFVLAREEDPSPLSSSSSPSPNRASFAPWSMPLVFFDAPPSVIPSIISGSPCVSVAIRSSRFTASAKRRYVSTLAITILASTVRISIPIRDTRTNTSITRPLSRISSRTSAKPLE